MKEKKRSGYSIHHDKVEMFHELEMAGAPAIPLRRHGELAPPQLHDDLVSASVGPAGEAIAVWASRSDAWLLLSMTHVPYGPPDNRRMAGHRDSRTAWPVPVRVTMSGAGQSEIVHIPDLSLAHVTAQPLPDARVLIVGRQCRYRPEAGAERNAIVYDADGRWERDGTFGNSIHAVASAQTGDIWVTYDDIGIGGDSGWGFRDNEPRPVGAPGVVRFTGDLAQAWAYPGSRGDWLWSHSSLNVDGDAMWIVECATSPLRRADGDRVSRWLNAPAYARTVLVDGVHAVFVGGGYWHRDRLLVGRLDDLGFEAFATFRLTMPDGESLPKGVTFTGRGDQLHAFVGTEWFTLSIDDITKGG